MKVELTEGEAESLLDFLELNFIRCVKDNPDLDSMLWMDNMMNIWRKCGGRKIYADGGDTNDDG